ELAGALQRLGLLARIDHDPVGVHLQQRTAGGLHVPVGDHDAAALEEGAGPAQQAGLQEVGMGHRRWRTSSMSTLAEAGPFSNSRRVPSGLVWRFTRSSSSSRMVKPNPSETTVE